VEEGNSCLGEGKILKDLGLSAIWVNWNNGYMGFCCYLDYKSKSLTSALQIPKSV
jgi:hypothetical protein